MSLPAVRRSAILSGAAAVFGLAVAWSASVAHAQDLHPGTHAADVSLTGLEVAFGITHGVGLGSTAFLAGLAAFAALVWLPAGRASGAGQDTVRAFCSLAWALLGLLGVAGLFEVSLYAIRASEEPFGPGLFGEALFGTRVGHVWLVRLGFGLLVTLAVNVAAKGHPSYWWVAAGLSSVPLMTLTQLSHAAAEGRFLPFFADWVHVIAASLWMGGLLGFPVLLLGPLRRMAVEVRMKLLGHAVRRFTRVATIAVATLVVTGAYAALVHVPDLSALVGTAYGRALIMKLGLVTLMLPIGARNLRNQGQGPFGRMVGTELVLALGVFVATGFLSSLPPP